MKIIREIKEEYKAIYKEPTSRDLTILALLLLAILSVIGMYKLLWSESHSGYYWIGVGAVLCASRLITPFFRQFYKVWIGFSVTVGYFISRVIMTLVFVLALLPTSLIMRLLGKDPMDRKWDPDAESYWIKREPQEDFSVERYEKQF
ncbi:SxtJ family membrane protein [Thermodesulfobacteriota bacterium]